MKSLASSYGKIVYKKALKINSTAGSENLHSIGSEK